MPRRTTDLLEVFQARRDDGAPSGRGRKRPGRKRASRKTTRSGSKRRGGFHGIFLNPRQVLLASCVLVLLLVLSFTAGIGIGRGGGRGAATTALSSTTAPAGTAFYIRGKVPRLDVLTGRPVDPDGIHEELVQKHRFRAQDIRVAEGAADHYLVFYGPFRTEAQARGVLVGRKLEVLPVKGFHPFAFAQIVRERR